MLLDKQSETIGLVIKLKDQKNSSWPIKIRRRENEWLWTECGVPFKSVLTLILYPLTLTVRCASTELSVGLFSLVARRLYLFSFHFSQSRYVAQRPRFRIFIIFTGNSRKLWQKRHVGHALRKI